MKREIEFSKEQEDVLQHLLAQTENTDVEKVIHECLSFWEYMLSYNQLHSPTESKKYVKDIRVLAIKWLVACIITFLGIVTLHHTLAPYFEYILDWIGFILPIGFGITTTSLGLYLFLWKIEIKTK